MSEDNTPPRKKLVLKKPASQTEQNTGSEHQKPRLRSGARARNVALANFAESSTVADETIKNKIQSRPLPRTAGYAKHRPSLADRLSRGAETIKEFADPQKNTRKPAVVKGDSSYEASKSPRREPSRQRTQFKHTEIFRVFAPCPQGLEEVLFEEISALGFENVEKGRAGCSFSSDWMGIMRANLYSRLATRILVQVSHAPIMTEDDIYELAYDTPWEQWFGAEHTLRVDTSAIKSPMKSLMFCNLKAKDGICDRLRDREGERPSIDTVRPDAKVHLFLSSDSATLYLDTSGESLFKRGWRLDKGEAPLRENLAAGILALSGWDPSMPLYDPFCGSGTILIEAAWIAQGVPPGISRPFGFERLRNFDYRRWKDLKADALSRMAPRLETPLYGSDINPHAIAAAKDNLHRARLADASIFFDVKDARHTQAPAEQGWLITNPPYGERMDPEDDTLWREWSSCLKKEFANWNVHIISSDLDLPKKLRLKPKQRIPLFNGALDCRLFAFEMVSDSYRNK
ncbi:MAG: class I SAM-dependent RNA methyltransferase [Advenella sp.]